MFESHIRVRRIPATNRLTTESGSRDSADADTTDNTQTTRPPTNGDSTTTESLTRPTTDKSRVYDTTALSATTSELTSSRNALANTDPPRNARSTAEVKLFIALPVILIAIALVIVIWLLLKKKFNRSKERRNQPDAEEKVGKLKDLKGKDGNIDVEYHPAVKPSNYYTEVGKEPKRMSKGAGSKGKDSPGQYEEIDKISQADQPKSMTSSNHGDNEGYEETSQHKTPFYYTLEPPDNGVSNGEVTSHQNLGYDKLDRGSGPNNIATGDNPGYAKLDHTPRGKNDYDRLNRDGTIEKPSQDDEISTNEYSQLDIQISTASASYDKLNHERTNTGK